MSFLFVQFGNSRDDPEGVLLVGPVAGVLALIAAVASKGIGNIPGSDRLPVNDAGFAVAENALTLGLDTCCAFRGVPCLSHVGSNPCFPEEVDFHVKTGLNIG